ncbi:hypothetical protein H6802_00785 [Candidatus Nomurabacteria bacterium]|uniref:Uncharacterized protein n=1 Tax=candidate division WWE3 bacterium TaxID=2053526 RepID=A0A955E1C5_UNCKA|nr:hypothetical protein [candidate division WWE3 bacterium]MCB9823480.1 hypothetical protein [Candidatus Nomurabacteria bacterium]MCB9827762.1 hypothetical protein [Candidatus Nomurabacteria bacterium]HXK52367.1 hypothetical protein [bacterium]
MNNKRFSLEQIHSLSIAMALGVFVILSLLDVDSSALKAVGFLFIFELAFKIIYKPKK